MVQKSKLLMVEDVYPEMRLFSNRVGLFNTHFQNFKQFGIPKAQLLIADVPYNIGKDGIVCIDRVESLENEQLMITSNNSKMFRRMWVHPLTSDAIVVEIK